MIKRFRRVVASVLVVSMSAIALPLPVQAGMISTDSVVTAAQSATDRERIANFLEREDVRLQLEAYGVNATDAKARVAAMTDEEAGALAQRMDSMPAGGFIGVIVFIFVLLLITDILGFTKVFPFTRSVR